MVCQFTAIQKSAASVIKLLDIPRQNAYTEAVEFLDGDRSNKITTPYHVERTENPAATPASRHGKDKWRRLLQQVRHLL
jgi:hypothetical protein